MMRELGVLLCAAPHLQHPILPIPAARGDPGSSSLPWITAAPADDY